MSELENDFTPETDVDNSIETPDISEPLENDDNSEPENQEPTSDGQEEPKGKFTDLENANRSYAELEKKLGEQSNELGELRKQAELAQQLQAQINEEALKTAKQNGFESIEDYEDSKAIGNFLADEYSKYINQTEYPEEMERLINELRVNPKQDILSTIEQELPISAIKEATMNLENFKGQLQAQKDEALKNEMYNSAEAYLKENIAKYPEEFKSPEFSALYGEAFKLAGCDLNTDTFVQLMRNFATSVLRNAGVQQSLKQENRDAVNAIAGTTLNDTPSMSGGKDVLDMTEAELRKELAKY